MDEGWPLRHRSWLTVRPVIAGTVIRASCLLHSFAPHFSALSSSVPYPALGTFLLDSPQELPSWVGQERKAKGKVRDSGDWRARGESVGDGKIREVGEAGVQALAVCV